MNEPGNFIDHYEILQVSRFADDFVIKAAYKVLASHFHPDKNQGDPSKDRSMQLVNVAYATLIDPIKRVAYDGLLQSMGSKKTSNSEQKSDEYSAGRAIGRVIVKELFRKCK